MIPHLPVPHRRSNVRAPVSLPARVFADGFEQALELECSDLSSTGMFVRGAPPLVRGDEVLLEFVPPGTTLSIVVDAVVVRKRIGGARGFGLRFARMPRNDTDVLRRSLTAASRTP